MAVVGIVVLIGVLAGQSKAAINIALGKPASTNKNIWSDYWPSKAVDGDIETIWSADHHGKPADPTWLKVDLEDVFAVEQIVLKVRTWQTQYAGYYVDYILYISEDGQAWEEIGQGRLIDYDEPIDTIELNGKSMRYLRYDVVGGTHWANLHEMEVYAEPTRLEICGPDTVAENSQAQYKAIAYFDNNSSEDITALGNWSVDDETIASIEAGLLTTESINAPQDIIITAEYTEGENTEAAEKQVSILTICPSGSALEFDGVDDYVEVNDDSSLRFSCSDSFSISFWVKPFGSGYILSKMRTSQKRGVFGYEITWASSKFSFLLESSFVKNVNLFTPENSAPAGSWYYVAAVYDNRDMKIYLNGELANSGTFNLDTGSTTPDKNLAIGARSYDSTITQYLNGEIDEVSIYNRALSAEEIWAGMHTKLTGDEDGLVGYWDFDEGEGQVVNDISGNGNDGQLGSEAGEDASDPVWVGSDVPVGICTMEELVERNISRAIDDKLAAKELIKSAMAKEHAIFEMFGELGLSRREIIKAKLKLCSAILRERLCKLGLNKSIKQLEGLLGLLGYEVEPESQP